MVLLLPDGDTVHLRDVLTVRSDGPVALRVTYSSVTATDSAADDMLPPLPPAVGDDTAVLARTASVTGADMSAASAVELRLEFVSAVAKQAFWDLCRHLM